MRTIRSNGAMQKWALDQRRRGKSIGFVPTMGALHAGHLALVRRARSIADRAVVSIFVNPLQFGRGEDLGRYPREHRRDAALLRKEGVDVLFAPGEDRFYPEGFQTHVEVEKISEGLCGRSRPGHFRGVATVVAKLFNIVQPDVALFGRKDFQQVRVIQRMVEDLSIPVRIIEYPTVREVDGLAMSSRNAYLSPEARERAKSLARALREAREIARRGLVDAGKVAVEVRGKLEADGLRVDYVEARSGRTLRPEAVVRPGTVLLAAVWAGDTRLIDNIVLR
ncbi:MAG: pantoate--beta-alanine ligase [Nitrospirae bacterium]|nr:pantoate--beta-alanine ligase [Nitrospirota bacterium]